MKMRIILLLLLLPKLGSSQILQKETIKFTKISEVKRGGMFVAGIEYTVKEKDTTYILTIKNDKYQSLSDYKSVSFTEEGETLNQLYKMMADAFTEENKKKEDWQKDFKLGNEDIMLTSVRFIGTTTLNVWINSGYVVLTEKQVNKLFAKK
ncbi:MAG: hypothetical protein RIQ62_368 [Bacteroidota bacterium]